MDRLGIAPSENRPGWFSKFRMLLLTVDLISRRVGPRPGDVIWRLNPDTRTEKDLPRRLREVLDSGLADIVWPVIPGERDGRTRLSSSGGSADLPAGRVSDSQLGLNQQAVRGAPRVLPSEFTSAACVSC